MTEYGRIHTDGSRSGGQPTVATQKAHTMVREVLAEWGIEPRSTTPAQLTIATTEALCRAIDQIEDLRQPTQSDAEAEAEGDARTILYLLGVRHGREDERAKIAAETRQPTQSDVVVTLLETMRQRCNSLCRIEKAELGCDCDAARQAAVMLRQLTQSDA